MMFRVCNLIDIYAYRAKCTNLKQSTVEMIYTSWRGHIFSVLTFSTWQVPFLEVTNVSLTFCWNYLDIFIMIISIGLNNLFLVFYYRLEGVEKKVGIISKFLYAIRLRNYV